LKKKVAIMNGLKAVLRFQKKGCYVLDMIKINAINLIV
jgi:hypothetical protein